jgi:hypothetical protein
MLFARRPEVRSLTDAAIAEADALVQPPSPPAAGRSSGPPPFDQADARLGEGYAAAAFMAHVTRRRRAGCRPEAEERLERWRVDLRSATMSRPRSRSRRPRRPRRSTASAAGSSTTWRATCRAGGLDRRRAEVRSAGSPGELQSVFQRNIDEVRTDST